jgi:hypothetical protein
LIGKRALFLDGVLYGEQTHGSDLACYDTEKLGALQQVSCHVLSRQITVHDSFR